MLARKPPRLLQALLALGQLRKELKPL